MFDPFEFMRAAAGGQAVADMAQRFALPPAQAQKAFEALLPAFAIGLERMSKNPELFTAAMGLAAGQHQPAFAQGLAAANTAMETGKQFTTALFGSPEIAKMVADQAAMASGVAAGVMQQMMPAVAAMMAAGVAKPAGPPNLFEQFQQAAQMAQDAFMPKPAAPKAPDNPWSALVASFLGGDAAKPEPKPEPKAPESAASETMSSMFEAGRQVQESYLSALKSIFEGLPGPGGGRKG